MEEQKEQENKTLKSRFKSGSILERWESDGEDFIDFHLEDEKTDQQNKDK